MIQAGSSGATPGVRLIRQENQGLAAARNTGLSALDTAYVTFLDADDRLEPRAIDAALACFARTPECGFVYGGHLYIDRDGASIGERYEPPGEHPYVRLLRGNFIAMHGTVMYRRDRLVEAGGFDATLRRCEDYDMYLRMAKRYPIAGYADLVAAYRLHGANMSTDHPEMLRAALLVHARHRPKSEARPEMLQAWRDGRRGWRTYYAREMALARYRSRQAGASMARSLPQLARLAVVSPATAMREAFSGVRHRAARFLPRRVRDRMPRWLGKVPGVGRIRFGDLDGTVPISRDYGFDRGTPIDRYYIERFLERHASEIVGRVLEVGGDEYTRRFGAARVTRADVLHVRPGNSRATIVGDLTDPSVLPERAFELHRPHADAATDLRRPSGSGGTASRARPRWRRVGDSTGYQSDRSRRVGQLVVLVVYAHGTRAPVRRILRPGRSAGRASRQRVCRDGISPGPGGRRSGDREARSHRQVVSGARRRARTEEERLMRTFVQRLRQRVRRLRPHPLILMYHRVASPAIDPWGLAVHPDRFEAHFACCAGGGRR